MATESVDIVVRDKVSSSIATKLNNIAKQALSAQKAITGLNSALSSINSSSFSRLATAIKSVDTATKTLSTTTKTLTTAFVALDVELDKKIVAFTKLTSAMQLATQGQKAYSRAATSGKTQEVAITSSITQHAAALTRLVTNLNRATQAQRRLSIAQKEGAISGSSSAVAQGGGGLSNLAGAAVVGGAVAGPISNSALALQNLNNSLRSNEKLAVTARNELGQFTKASVASKKATRQLNTHMKHSTSIIRKGAGAWSSLLLWLAAYQVAIRTIQSFDTDIRMRSTIKAIVDTTRGQASAISDELYAVAERSRAAVEEVSKAFIRFDLSLRNYGVSVQESIRFTETVTKALIAAGTAPQEASSALLQLSQAMNKGKLDGDEFRTMMETVPTIMDRVAITMGLVGKHGEVLRGKLLDLAPQGKITASVIRKAVLSMGDEVDKIFKEMPLTIGQALTLVSNRFTQWIGDIQESTGAVSALAHAIEKLTRDFTALIATLLTAIITYKAFSIGMRINAAARIRQQKIVAAEELVASRVEDVLSAKRDVSTDKRKPVGAAKDKGYSLARGELENRIRYTKGYVKTQKEILDVETKIRKEQSFQDKLQGAPATHGKLQKSLQEETKLRKRLDTLREREKIFPERLKKGTNAAERYAHAIGTQARQEAKLNTLTEKQLALRNASTVAANKDAAAEELRNKDKGKANKLLSDQKDKAFKREQAFRKEATASQLASDRRIEKSLDRKTDLAQKYKKATKEVTAAQKALTAAETQAAVARRGFWSTLFVGIGKSLASIGKFIFSWGGLVAAILASVAALVLFSGKIRLFKDDRTATLWDALVVGWNSMIETLRTVDNPFRPMVEFMSDFGNNLRLFVYEVADLMDYYNTVFEGNKAGTLGGTGVSLLGRFVEWELTSLISVREKIFKELADLFKFLVRKTVDFIYELNVQVYSALYKILKTFGIKLKEVVVGVLTGGMSYLFDKNSSLKKIRVDIEPVISKDVVAVSEDDMIKNLFPKLSVDVIKNLTEEQRDKLLNAWHDALLNKTTDEKLILQFLGIDLPAKTYKEAVDNFMRKVNLRAIVAKGTKDWAVKLKDRVTGEEVDQKHVDFLDKFNRKLEDRIKLFGVFGEARKVQQEMDKLEEDALSKKIVLSEKELAAIRTKITNVVHLEAVQSKLDSIYEQTTGVLYEYTLTIEAANKALTRGMLTTQQYSKIVDEARIKVLETNNSIANGIEHGVLTKLQGIDGLTKQVSSIVTTSFDSMSSTIVDFVAAGKFSLDNFKDGLAQWGLEVIKIVSKVVTELLIIKPIVESLKSALTGGGSSLGGGLLGGLVSGVGSLLGFASGGAFTVGGSAGRDTNLVSFKATKGERVIVQTPDQQKQQDRQSSNNVVVNMTINTPNPAAFRASESQVASQMNRMIQKAQRRA